MNTIIDHVRAYSPNLASVQETHIDFRLHPLKYFVYLGPGPRLLSESGDFLDNSMDPYWDKL